MNLVYGSFCPLHEGNTRCPCRTLTTNASIWTAAELGDAARVRTVVTVKGRKPDSLDPHGYTPLHLAAQNGRLSVVRYLLEAGASPDGAAAEAGGCGATPLHRAAFAGQLPCVRALLSAGASTSAADASFLDMRTPLHKAAAQGHLDVCVALLEAGADPNACDAAGNSPLDVLVASAPIPSAAGESSPRGHGGGVPEARSTVTLTGGAEERDWEGVRKVLERYGGCRNEHGGGAGGKGGGGEGTSSDPGDDPGGRGPGGREDASIAKQECAAAPPSLEPVPAAPNEAGRLAGENSVGLSGGSPTALDGRHSTAGTTAGGVVAVVVPPQLGAAVAGGGDKAAAARKVVTPVEAPREGTGSGMGVPCGECLVPKVVMVRAPCCGGLLCKPCVRDVCASRQNCRRCRETSS